MEAKISGDCMDEKARGPGGFRRAGGKNNIFFRFPTFF
jgi:hypothetical protein